ncbi:hypothetical protein [Arenibaculum sp.]|uniref:hypothetical protein n=1 Tax=Arenibaculum sp. TaxID=2865862 RepID=UPI002E15E0F5|nr:hypothetical protein [Arenibaculum sp.]
MQSSPARISAILWTVNLSSIAASIFSYVYLSYFVYERTGQVLYSELVLLAPLAIPVLLCLAINRLTGFSPPRQLLVVTNLAGAAVAVATYVLIEDYVFVAVIGALLIGFLDALQRVGRTVAVKNYFSAADVKYAIPLTHTAQFIAGGLAGVGLSFYKDEVTPQMALTIVTAAFAIAMIAALLLPRLPWTPAANPLEASAKAAGGAFGAIGRLLASLPALRYQFVAFVLFVSVFQGFFNVSRVALPTHQLNLSQAYVGYLQIISAMSALAGALLFVWLGKRNFVFGRAAVATLSVVSLAAMVGSTSTRDVATSYTMYLVYMFVWEILFFKYQSDVVNFTPTEHMPLVATFQYAAVYLGMIVTAFIGGIITHYTNLTTAALAFTLAYGAVMILHAPRTGQPLASGKGAS